MDPLTRRHALARAALAMAMPALASWPAIAADYPARPVRMVVPYGPGGASDLLARSISDGLAREMGQPVVVDNKPGAGGVIAATAVLSQPADGHTIYYVTESMYVLTQLVNQHANRPVTVDMRKEFAPITTIVDIPIVLIVRSDVPASNLQAFIAYARSQPAGTLNFASDGVGSSTHLAGEMLKMAGRFDAVHVPYKGTGDQTQGILAGQIHFAFLAVQAGVNYARQGKMKVIAVAGSERVRQLPDVATAPQQGFPDLTLTSWHGFAVRTGTDPAIVTALNRQIRKVAAAPELVQKMAASGLVVATGTPAQAAARADASFRKWSEVLAASKVRLD
ncbi:Bug family tripartite tricarboxylate transporter substrate binding protein [Xenophilus azovorans]|uniref:Bug family tripartite tricarboxylate transporter substrate binding protein n=1 Tax=Xenophilus azovorans TaxID=151755 RepID=UPI000690884E|nr:tripartite tricarboxylate transporter substrate binding protein [Xenophilus azovorans]